MSSDNGIYVLVSPTKHNKKVEYRIAHGSAIENIDYYPIGTIEYNAMEVVYFGKSPIYDTEKKATEAALKMENNKYTEYGICILPLRPKQFPQMSLKEAENILK